ncbi:MAG: c-type cytochrome [Agriterribacter sp.]
MKAIKITGIIILIIVVLVAGAGAYVKFALPNTGAAPDITVEKTSTRIERGKYLANSVAVCMDCHSTRDWSVFAGPMLDENIGGGGEKFGKEMGFPGNFYAPNITPYSLSNWTDGEIFRAITTGVNKHGRALFPVMGYQRFGKMDKEDIYDIIAYIRTLAPVKNDIPVSEAEFPVSLLINTMPQEAKFESKPPVTDKLKYGAYIINAAGCVECHSKTDKGKIIPGSEFGGGMEFRMPGGVLRSSNISPDKETGIGNWTAAAFVQRFKAYTDSSARHQKLSPGDFNTPMPWTMYATMTETDLEAIYIYLQQVKPIQHQVVKFEKEVGSDK